MHSKTTLIKSICLALGFASLNAYSYHIAGTIYCDASNDGVASIGDLALSGINVTLESDIYGAFYGISDANGEYYIDTAIQGGFDDIYRVSIDLAPLGPLAEVTSPEAGTHSIDLVNNLFADNVDFLVGAAACSLTTAQCGDGIVDSGEQCDDGNLFGGDGCSASCTIELGAQGCTPGYWKQAQHFDSWAPSYSPDTLFSDIFENAFPGMTLLQVLEQNGGGVYALGRHAVAALLNTHSQEVNYGLFSSGVIDSFNSVYPGVRSQYEAAKDIFAEMNEAGCPLD